MCCLLKLDYLVFRKFKQLKYTVLNWNKLSCKLILFLKKEAYFIFQIKLEIIELFVKTTNKTTILFHC